MQSAYAVQGPRHISIRANAMGGAHIAVVDDKEAIYYNYAGLNQIGKLGRYEKHPEYGYYPENSLDLRLNFGGAGLFDKYSDVYKLAKNISDLYSRAEKAANKANAKNPNSETTTQTAFMDSLSVRDDLTKKINSFDHLLFTTFVKSDFELALHNFGAAIWVEGTINPYMDGAMLIPIIGVDTFYIDAVAQMGGAVGITEDLSIGAGVKLMKRQSLSYLRADATNFENLLDTLDERTADAFDLDEIAVGMDFGVLFNITKGLRVGASLNDVFFNELNNGRVTPNLGFGLNYSPRFFARNTAYSRKMNIALDYADCLNQDRTENPLAHVNFGLEFEQVLLAWPGYNNAYRALKLSLAGGFKGGYPTFGVGVEVLRFFDIKLASWGEERGYYLGQDEIRYYMLEFSIGI